MGALLTGKSGCRLDASAINPVVGSGDERRLVRSQEGSEIGDLLAGSEALERNVLDGPSVFLGLGSGQGDSVLLRLVFDISIPARGMDNPRRDAVDEQVVLRVGTGEVFGQVQDRGLEGGIVRVE